MAEALGECGSGVANAVLSLRVSKRIIEQRNRQQIMKRSLHFNLRVDGQPWKDSNWK